MTPGELRRLYFIIHTFLSYGLDELIPKMRITLPLRIWRRMLFWMPNRHQDQPLGARLRLALQELGPQVDKIRPDAFHPPGSLSAAYCRSAGAVAGPRGAL